MATDNLMHPIRLSKDDLEGLDAMRGLGAQLVREELERARQKVPYAMPDAYIQWAKALEKSDYFWREVDFRLRMIKSGN